MPTLQEVRAELTELRTQIPRMRASLETMKGTTVRNAEMAARNKSAISLLELQMRLYQKRAADLARIEESLLKGALSEREARVYTTSKMQLRTQERLLKTAIRAFDEADKLRRKMETDAGSMGAYVQNRRETAKKNSGSKKAQEDLDTALKAVAVVERAFNALGNDAHLLDAIARVKAEAVESRKLMEKLTAEGADPALISDERLFSWFVSLAEIQETLHTRSKG